MPKHRRHQRPPKRPSRQRRQVWIYPCRNHPGMKCRSHFKANFDLELCAKCRKAIPDERQTALFPTEGGVRAAPEIEQALADFLDSVSACCRATWLSVEGEEGTNYAECTACNQPCNLKNPNEPEGPVMLKVEKTEGGYKMIVPVEHGAAARAVVESMKVEDEAV